MASRSKKPVRRKPQAKSGAAVRRPSAKAPARSPRSDRKRSSLAEDASHETVVDDRTPQLEEHREWVAEPEEAPQWVPLEKPPAADPMVQAIHLRRIYSTAAATIAALDGVDLVLDRGEMVVVMGPSGSGKTTLLNCLSGLDEVSSGEVIVEGRSLSRMSDSKRTRYRAKRMGFVFQAFNLLPVLSAEENVELPLLLTGTRASRARRRAREALASVGLSGRASHRPAELSAGEQQRVAIARAIAPEPAVLWADEPTGNLDSENAENVIGLLKRLNQERNITVLMVTHDHHIASWAERVLRMRDGRIVGEGIV